MQRWIKIVNEVNKDPYSRRRVIFDILNEPDSAVSAALQLQKFVTYGMVAVLCASTLLLSN